MTDLQTPSADQAIAGLQARIAELESEMVDQNLLLETVMEHGTTLENELMDLVGTLTHVSDGLERGEFDPQPLADLVKRPDEMGQLGRMFMMMGHEVNARERRLRMLKVVIPASVALSAEKNFNRLLEGIVIEAQKLVNADAGTLYLLTEAQKLEFVILRNQSLGLALGGEDGKPVTSPPIEIYDDQGQPNDQIVAAYVVLNRARVNVPNVYADDGSRQFDLSDLKAFDLQNNYHTVSLLSIPLEDVGGTVVGVLQLINAQDPQTGAPIPFVLDDVLETLVMLASAAVSSYRREEALRREIQALRIQIDYTRQAQQVEEITGSEYFRELQQKVQDLRKRRNR